MKKLVRKNKLSKNPSADASLQQASFQDNRPEAVAQLKYQEMADEFTSGKGVVQQQENEPIQLQSKHLKRFKNVITLGIRKAYVKHKRARRNAAAPVEEEEIEIASPLDQFVEAYGKSRYYHNVMHSELLPSVEEHGLLNYEDQERKFDDPFAGMSNLGGEYEGDEKKGVFMGPKEFMIGEGEGMRTNPARTFLSSKRTVKHHWDMEGKISPQEMFRDSKYPGAWITKDSIKSDHIATGRMLDLLDSDAPKLNVILTDVKSHYKGHSPSIPEMKVLLREAVKKRRLSNAPFDNIE